MFAVCLIAASALCGYFAIREPAAVPVTAPLVAETAVIDLGVLEQGKTKTASFRLENHSGKTILVSTIVGSCSCTKQKLSQARIETGQSATLALVYDSGISRGPISAGAKVLYFLEGEEKLRRLDLRLKATVEPGIAFSTDELEFIAGKAGSRSVTLSPHRVEKFVVSSVACTHRSFKARLKPGAGTRTVTVSFDPSQWVDSRLRPELLIKTDFPAQPLLRISLVVRADTEISRRKRP